MTIELTSSPTTTTTTTTLTESNAHADVKHMKAQLGTGLPGQHNQKEKYFTNESGSARTLTEADYEMGDTIYFKNCTDMEYKVEAACTKIFMEGCHNLKMQLSGRVITQVVEVWKCDDLNMEINTKVQTLQLDMCKRPQVQFAETDSFNRLVWSAVHDIHLRFADNDQHVLKTGADVLHKLNANIHPETDQFIVRLIPHKLTGKPQLLNELIVRLENGFPTTEREARQFEERQEANLQKLAQEILGKEVRLGKKKDLGPKVKPNEPCKCGSGKKHKKCCGTNLV